MAVIPRHVYRRVEAALHRRGEAVERADQRYRRAYEHATGIGGGLGKKVRTSGTGDRLARDVITMVEAGDVLDEAERWEKVFRRLDEYFKGREETRAAVMLYREHLPQTVVAQRMRVDRQTVRRWRDAYVCHAALLAVEEGLIVLGGAAE